MAILNPGVNLRTGATWGGGVLARDMRLSILLAQYIVCIEKLAKHLNAIH